MVLSQDVPANRGADVRPTTGSWDPYDIWLTRVKQPRDRRPQRAGLVIEVPVEAKVATADAGATEPLLLRGVT